MWGQSDTMGQQWYWLPETPTHSTQGLQKYISARAKEQINLNTGFGRAKFKQQQKKETQVSEQSSPFPLKCSKYLRALQPDCN